MTPDYAFWMLSLLPQHRPNFDEAIEDLTAQNVLMPFGEKIAVPSWEVGAEYLGNTRSDRATKGRRKTIEKNMAAYRKKLDRLAAQKGPDPLETLTAKLALL